jgi:hypothetical protein
MTMQYGAFYKKFGVRRIDQISKPPMSDMKFLELPMSSIYHFLTYDGVENGPPNDDFLFRNIKKPILVGHITELADHKGFPRKQNLNLNSLIRDYHSVHRRTRLLRNLSFGDRDHTALIVYNYCFLNKTYRYIRSFYTEYYQWNNDFATVMSNIATVSQESQRQHYLFTKSPKVIPSMQQLNLAMKSTPIDAPKELEVATENMTQGLLKIFRDDESFLLLELWKWLSLDRHNSLISRIPENKIHLVNFVFTETGKWTVINLGQLNSFRKIGATPSQAVLPPAKQTLEPIQLQKRLLRMIMSVMEVRTVTANTQNNTSVGELEAEQLEGNGQVDLPEIDDFDDQQEGVDDTTLVDVENNVLSDEVVALVESTNDQADIDEDETDEQALERIAKEDEKLDQDLYELNEIAERQEVAAQDQEISLKDTIYADPESALEDSVIAVCDRLADEGLLSAAEYKRFTKLASSYKSIISPDGVTTLDEFVKIPEKMLKITDSSAIADSATILDKSMLKSSLLSFDDRYISNVLHKDMAAMVLNIQKAGVAVTGYKVEQITDILGSYEMHRVRLTPVIGKQSTLVFKIPVINKDGTFLASGVRYRIRKQRGDLPIRKISPSKVALTSYYGKLFITRGKKKADDYGHWLQSKVMEKILNREDTDITNSELDNVFDKSLTSPRTYSALSEVFKSFTCKGFSLLFDNKEKLKTYSPEAVKMFETAGSLIVGRNTEGSYLVLDTNNTLYTTKGSELVPYGTIESFLSIDNHNAPVEFASVGVFGKDVPIGVVLGYQIGFEKLMRLLEVTPRRVNAGSRVNLGSHEYALTFSDETLVFSRDNRFASMVLAGFNDFAKSLRLFSVYSFDKRGVYLNLLEASGLGSRYLREVELMNKIFIDSIARDLLIEMKEPTTFQGLLLRSCELLLTDQHPDELDPAMMRIKGYERLAGAIYSEMVQSLRVHNGKMGRSNSAIEMNPYAVWKRISEDPAKAQVSEINPIHSLKEAEAVTFGGTGGRNKRSMVKATRAYHPNDMGTISESTVDSTDVAVNVFTSADPQFTSLRGMSKRYEIGKTGITALMSTSALMAVASDRDD